MNKEKKSSVWGSVNFTLYTLFFRGYFMCLTARVLFFCFVYFLIRTSVIYYFFKNPLIGFIINLSFALNYTKKVQQILKN